MSDESSDSLPSPGFVSVFRNRLSSPGQEEEAAGGRECEGEGGTEGREADRGEEVRGGEVDGGGEADIGGGGDVGEGNVGDVGGPEHRPLPGRSTAWTMEALLRSKTAPEPPVMEFRSEIVGGNI